MPVTNWFPARDGRRARRCWARGPTASCAPRRAGASRTGAARPPCTPDAMQFLGSLVFTSFFLLFTFVYAIFFTIASLLLPFRGRFALARLWAWVLLTMLRWTCRLDYRVEGQDYLPRDAS